jgi:hypothetical protein
LRASVLKAISQAIPHLAGMEAGWTQSLERFEAYMAHAREDAA